MSVLLSDIKFYAAATTPEDDSATDIGGAILTSKKFDFADTGGPMQAVSSSTGDTTQTITLTYRTTTGAITTLSINLNGQTVVTDSTTFERILKAVKSASCAGDVALEKQTAEFSDTLASLGVAADEVVLPSGASGSDDTYTGMIFRATGGTGNHKIAQIIKYVGSTKTATLSRSVAAIFDATTQFRISKGVYFDLSPAEITYVVRMDYNSAADPASGSSKNFYQKGFFKHTDASASGLTLTSCKVTKLAGDARITFTLATANNDSGTNGGGNNRQVAPVSGIGTFDTSDKTTPADIAPSDKIGVWMKLADAAGAAAIKSTWTPSFQGQTI